jgi:predicted glycoside hydrolase/deacetylase ChbG (UPF0249 family)
MEYNERKIIITADDYGVCENVNEGIRLAARLGCISNISAFTNFGNSLEGLKAISAECPGLGIGVHLNLNTGKPVSYAARIPTLVNELGHFYDIGEFILHLPEISADEVYTEIRAQISVLTDSGIKLDHISDHFGVLSFHPPFYELRNRLALECGVPVRSPVTASRKFPAVYKNDGGMKLVRRLARKLAFRSPLMAVQLKKQFNIEEMERKSGELNALGIPHPDLMIDCFYGDPTPANLLRILENLPPGTSEILVHLGNYNRQKEYPPGLCTVYLKNRECELMTITSPYLDEYLSNLKIKKVTYSDIYK